MIAIRLDKSSNQFVLKNELKTDYPFSRKVLLMYISPLSLQLCKK